MGRAFEELEETIEKMKHESHLKPQILTNKLTGSGLVNRLVNTVNVF